MALRGTSLNELDSLGTGDNNFSENASKVTPAEMSVRELP
jgi:hypothetical protein